VVVLVAAVLGGLGTYLVRSGDSSTHTTTVVLESLPGSVFGVRNLQDHYVLQFEEAVRPPIDVPAGVSLHADLLEPWDPFFEVSVTAEDPETADAVLERATGWVVEDSRLRNRAEDDLAVSTWSDELALATADLRAAEAAADSAPDDTGVAHERDVLRDRVSTLEQRVADASARAARTESSVVAVVRHPASQDDTATDDALVGALVGFLLGTAAMAMRRP
jgi:hypothetical protein